MLRDLQPARARFLVTRTRLGCEDFRKTSFVYWGGGGRIAVKQGLVTTILCEQVPEYFLRVKHQGRGGCQRTRRSV